MNTGIIGPRTSIEDPQTASEAAARPGWERSRDARGTPANAVLDNSPGLLKARETGQAGRDAGKLRQAAEEFEALLLAQILQTVREAGSGGWLGSSESQQMSSTMELAETQLARAMAQSGGLGITKQLAGELPRDSSSDAAAQRPGPAMGSGAARLEGGSVESVPRQRR
jgi:Rod binding domain-containing protein